MRKQGKQVKEVSSIRLEHRVKRIIQAEFGSLQAFVDYHVKRLIEWREKRGGYKDESK